MTRKFLIDGIKSRNWGIIGEGKERSGKRLGIDLSN